MRRSLVVVSVVLLLTGCFEIEQSINIEKDLSGTADFHLGIDMEPMVIIMAQVGKEMEGKSGPLTAAEIAKAKAEFKKNAKKSDGPGAAQAFDRKEVEKELPKGIKLLDFKATDKEFGMATDFKFGFDRINNLVDVKFPSKEGGGDPTKKNIIDSPFEGLEVLEKGNLITIQTKPQNPTESVKEQAAEGPKMDKETEKMLEAAFGKLRVVYRLTAPFTVVSHNATRKEGDTLIWEYDLKKFQEMEKKGVKMDDVGVKVTYRR